MYFMIIYRWWYSMINLSQGTGITQSIPVAGSTNCNYYSSFFWRKMVDLTEKKKSALFIIGRVTAVSQTPYNISKVALPQILAGVFHRLYHVHRDTKINIQRIMFNFFPYSVNIFLQLIPFPVITSHQKITDMILSMCCPSYNLYTNNSGNCKLL